MPVFIVDLAELCIIVIMFSFLGFNEKTGNFIKSIKRSWGIVFFGAIAPFAIAYTLMIAGFLLNLSVPLIIRWWKSHFLKATTQPTDAVEHLHLS